MRRGHVQGPSRPLGAQGAQLTASRETGPQCSSAGICIQTTERTLGSDASRAPVRSLALARRTGLCSLHSHAVMRPCAKPPAGGDCATGQSTPRKGAQPRAPPLLPSRSALPGPHPLPSPQPCHCQQPVLPRAALPAPALPPPPTTPQGRQGSLSLETGAMAGPGLVMKHQHPRPGSQGSAEGEGAV